VSFSNNSIVLLPIPSVAPWRMARDALASSDATECTATKARKQARETRASKRGKPLRLLGTGALPTSTPLAGEGGGPRQTWVAMGTRPVVQTQ